MNQVIKTIIYPVKDLAHAKTLFSKLLGIEPYADGRIMLSLGLETKK